MEQAGSRPKRTPSAAEAASSAPIPEAPVVPQGDVEAATTALPTELADIPLDGEEIRRFTNARHHAVSSLFTDLAKTARSFILYDPRNDAIRNFLTSLLQSFSTILAQEGDIKITVQPFELWFEGEVVYLNRDRERSLAFRLYRDGVRALTFHPGFDWPELMQILQVLSIRFTGVHQHEDDVVTLLWKANFAHLDVVAVEGFVPRDDEVDVEQTEQAKVEIFTPAPSADEKRATTDLEPWMPDRLIGDYDHPAPYLPDFEAVGWVEVPAERIEQLRDEASDHGLPASCLALLERTRRLLEDEDNKWRFSEVSHLYAEIREFLLASEQLTHLEKLVDLLEELARSDAPPWDPWRQEAVRKILRGCGDDTALHKLLHTVAVESRVVPPELIRLIARVCEDPFTILMETFMGERSTAARAFARQLLEHFGAEHIDLLQERFREASGTVAADLLRTIAHIDVEGTAPFIAQQCWHVDPDVQDEALLHLERIPYTGRVGRSLFEAVRRVDAARRIKVFRLILRSKDRRFVDRMARHVEQMGDGMSAEEADQFGRVMGRLGGRSSVPRWKGWLEASGWMRRTLHGPLSKRVAAAAALGEIAGEEAEDALRDAAAVSKGVTLEWIERAIARREYRARKAAS